MAHLLLLGLVAGCSPEAGDGSGNNGPEGPTGDPGITLDSPNDGAGTYSGSFKLAWTVQGVVLDPEGMDREPVDRHAHVHVYLDDEMVAESAADGLKLDGLTSGPHLIRVRLAGNDHEELTAEDEATVDARAPTMRILSPPDGAMLSSSSTPVSVSVEDFDLSPIDDEDVFGVGHFRVLVDGEVRDFGSDPLAALATGIPSGAHTVGVELVTNDGKPLDPPVIDEITVNVPVGAPGVYWDRSVADGVYDSATLPLAISTTAFTLYPRELARPPIEGEGHMHWYMDGTWLDATADTARVLQNVAPGAHIFEARLVTNDQVELPIVDRMWVNVAEDRPDALATWPLANYGVGPAFVFEFGTENFTMDAAGMDGANAPHTGHAQLLLDGVLTAESAENAIPLSGLLPGTHLVRLQLVNNDRTPLVPAVYQEFPVTVQ